MSFPETSVTGATLLPALEGQPIERATLTELACIATVISWILPPAVRWWRWLCPSLSYFPWYIPTSIGRNIIFKFMKDATANPGPREVVRYFLKMLANGDISTWEKALQMPHYNARSMPAIALDQVLHLCQIAHSHRFRLYDYGSVADNMESYGTPSPPDIADEYWRLGSLPVDLVAGLSDGIIPPDNIRRHYAEMKKGGLKVTLKEFAFGHLDFTFKINDDLSMYLMKLLRK
ncbi:MAG: hypothetical protein WDW38_006758 [Sanguina aurantia]